MKKFISISLFILISNITLFSQDIPSFITDSLNIYVERALNQWQIPGAAVLIVKDGKVVIAKGYGVKEIGTNNKVDENTLFMIGSNTKAFTGAALAMLESEGKLKLEDKVVQYLPDFKMKDPWVTKELNIQDIVSHKMGLETYQGDFMYWTSDLTTDEVIEKFGMLTPKYDFRTKYGYTNAGYTIAGKIIEKISGLTWANFLKQEIFGPLKMENTISSFNEYSLAKNISKPHTLIDSKILKIPFPNLDNLAPAGGIASSIIDISNWIIAQLDSGRFENERAIPIEVIYRIRQPLTIDALSAEYYPFNRNNFSLYGMGWWLDDYEGKEIVYHTGGVNGFLSSITLIPEEKLGIAVLTNTDQNYFAWAMRAEVIDAVLGLPYRNYSDYYFKVFNKKKEDGIKDIQILKDSVIMNIKTEIFLEDFVGKYKNELYGFAEIKQIENYLELYFEHHPKLTAKLEYMGNQRFSCIFSDPIFGVNVIPFNFENNHIKDFTLFVDAWIDSMYYKFVKQ
jgi:CubicO group peptidase (beta-lactamase class C family)